MLMKKRNVRRRNIYLTFFGCLYLCPFLIGNCNKLKKIHQNSLSIFQIFTRLGLTPLLCLIRIKYYQILDLFEDK